VDFSTGEILVYRFQATNGSVTEVINSQLIAVPTPQTIRFKFSSTSFPAVEAWDMSCSNQDLSGLFQVITVRSRRIPASNSGPGSSWRKPFPLQWRVDGLLCRHSGRGRGQHLELAQVRELESVDRVR